MNLFKENTAYCYCYFEGQSDIKEIDVTEYSSVESIIWHVKEILSELIQLDADITLFGNLNGTDFFRKTANSSFDLDSLLGDSAYDDYHNNWDEICESFQEELDNELYVFEMDNFDMGEFVYRYAPENEQYQEETVTRKGWKNITNSFFDTLHSVVENYPISVITETADDVDELEYNDYLYIRFEIEPFVKTKLLLF